ncbi:MAG: cytochrome b [Desulfobacterales bacterium S3730MH5]|nr:MAG: cytochrome b [Desulfobacterales bacterium S3730MH5]
MEKPNMVYLNPLSVRIWHWLHAFGIITLCLTGAQLRFPEYVSLFGTYRSAVMIHDFCGILVCLDYFIWFFYYIFVAKTFTKLYVPNKSDIPGIVKQLQFYGFNYFRGLPNPHHCTPDHKFNSMQKGAYLMIMMTLVPLIMATGLLLIFVTEKWMMMLGGIKVVIEIHFLIACCFAAFLFVHMYLATLGHTFWAHLITMINGWEEEVEGH